MASKDKLKKAGAGMDKFFSTGEVYESQGIEMEILSTEEKKPKKKTTRRKTALKKDAPQKTSEKKQTKVFSFRAEVALTESWKTYADAKGLKVSEFGELALNEYMKRHKLNDSQQQIYDLKMGQKKL